MKLRQLQCLCAVVDGGFNISRAGEALYATQPAVSKQLRQLEEELGTDLLLRQGGRPVALTESGERILGWARRALQCTDNIRAISRERGGESGGAIVLATSHTHANHLLPGPIAAFKLRFPKVRLHVIQGTPTQVSELIRDGKASIGVTNLPEALPRDVLAVPFLTSPRLLVLPVGHVLLKEKTLTLAKLALHPMVLPQSERRLGSRIVRRFQQAGLETDVVVHALDADVVKTYVAAGMGIGVVPDFAFSAARDKGLRSRDVSHLFDPAESAVQLKRQSQLPRFAYQFLVHLNPLLEPGRLEALVLESA
ncbi:LysR substrate-binding domain-containing protein [Hydrogenophaga sp.]|uniref:LysR substrate-binding domain-containing protein n=1 Tax=Hydrogenophaga sp. TaxID=1904254 RepID=UPI002719C1ED|nr:LysR substrate-binding domain-containing protein [Hydrogenophaga sp.]MDO9433968.1 LysR substrate-binding domain-containing protein [Hydrogenophaga sp.]